MPTTTTREFVVARNARTTLYEIHAKGCKHLISKHLEVCSTQTGATGAEVAAAYEAGNDDIYTKLGPCARA